MNEPIERAVSVARRRIGFGLWLTALGRMLCAGGLVALGLIVAEKLLAVSVGWWVHGVVMGGACLLASVAAWRRLPDRAAVARRVDQHFGLKDGLSTGRFALGRGDDPVARCVVTRARQTARELPISEGFPVRLAAAWGWLGALVLIGVAVWVWMPQMDLGGLARRRAVAEAQLEKAATVKQAIEQAHQSLGAIRHVQVESAEESGTEQTPPPVSMPEALSQLTEPDLTRPVVQRQTAAELFELQDRLQEQAQQQQALADALQNVLSRLEPVDPGPADPLAEALSRADFRTAQEAAEQLMQSLQELSPQDRQALRRQLDQLADQTQHAAERLADQEAQIQRQIDRQPANQRPGEPRDALSRSSEAGSPPPDPSTREASKPDPAEQMAQEPEPNRGNRQHDRQSQDVCQGLAERLAEAARSVGQQSDARSDPQPGERSGGDRQAQESFEQLGRLLERFSKLNDQHRQTRRAQQHTREALERLVSSPRDASGLRAAPRRGFEQAHDMGRSGGVRGNDGHSHGDAGRAILSASSGHRTAVGPHAGQPVAVAREAAQQAVADHRVPKRYHETVRGYFNQLPDPASDATSPPGRGP